MLIATIVFGPFAGAAAAAVIGKKNEKAGEYAALFLTLCVLGLSLALVPLAGAATLYPSGECAIGAFFAIPGIMSGSGLTFCVTGFRAVYAVITAIMWVGTTMFSPEYFAHENRDHRDHVGWDNNVLPGIFCPRERKSGEVQVFRAVYTGSC